jgi:uncharacterized membrane protein YkvI
MNKNKKNKSYPMYFAIFGFMLIIATGTDLFITRVGNIPTWVSIIGLILIIIALILRKRES